MASVDPKGNYETAVYSLADGSEHTIYTVPVGYLAVMVTHIVAAEAAGGARTLTLKARVSGVDYALGYQVAIAVNAPFDREFKPFVLKTGDTIKATASAATVDIAVTFVAQARV